MYELPTSVVVNDHKFTITNKGDYRMVLDCFAALRDTEMSEGLRVLASLLIFYNEFNEPEDVTSLPEDVVRKLVEEMYRFFNQGQDQTIGYKADTSLVDWEKDEILICSAVNVVANQEIRLAPYMHWWTFLGYYMAIGESTLATVMGIRSKIVKHEKLEKWEQKFRRDNPEYFEWKRMTSSEAQKQDDLIREMWNKGGVQ